MLRVFLGGVGVLRTLSAELSRPSENFRTLHTEIETTYKRLFDALHGAAATCSTSHVGVTTTLISYNHGWYVQSSLHNHPSLTLQSHLCSLHFSIPPSDPKSSPYSHSHPPWYCLSFLLYLLLSPDVGQPTNILYSYLHTNYVNLSSNLPVMLLIFCRIPKIIF